MSSPDLSEVLDASNVIVCCGSGGVGKTTIAAVMGLEAARRGRRVVVVTIDPARRLADALGLTDGLAAEPQLVHDVVADGDGELWAMMLDTAATFDGLVRRLAQEEASGLHDRLARYVRLTTSSAPATMRAPRASRS